LKFAGEAPRLPPRGNFLIFRAREILYHLTGTARRTLRRNLALPFDCDYRRAVVNHATALLRALGFDKVERGYVKIAGARKPHFLAVGGYPPG